MDMQMTFVAKPTDTSGQGTREGSRAGSRAGDAAPSVFEQEGAKRKRKCRERKRLRKLLLEGGGGDGEGAPREEESAREETVAADVDDMPGDISGDAFFVEASTAACFLTRFPSALAIYFSRDSFFRRRCRKGMATIQ